MASVASAGLILTGGLATQRAFADETTANTSPLSSLVTKMAAKFNLKEADVQAVVDEVKAEKDVEMKKMAEDRLSQAVTDGDITQAQKDLITTKQTEVETKMTEIKKITDDGDRRAAMDQLMADVSKWAADNDISGKWLRFAGPGPKGHGGPGGHGGRGEKMMMMRDF
ncbi:MAG TPA: hypothetical protein VLA04_05700 [Verrucomicrobiae bacterium]|nr:hypothetical protein [Verrucomicrobiae bacterium]